MRLLPKTLTNYHASTALGMIRETRNADIVSNLSIIMLFSMTQLLRVFFFLSTLFLHLLQKSTYFTLNSFTLLLFSEKATIKIIHCYITAQKQKSDPKVAFL